MSKCHDIREIDKIKKLKNILQDLKSVVIAYSGGLDSTFLLKVSVDTLGKQNVIAVTARSETFPYSEYKEARRFAKKIGCRHISIRTSELGIKGFSVNPVNRCYFCKKELFEKLHTIRRRWGMTYLLDGANLDDLKDIRHGKKAAFELGVRSPLLEAAITKDDIRRQSKRLRLETWDKPSFACLASRFPFHSKITAQGLRKVCKAEECVRGLGIRQVRVRVHGKIARIEALPRDFDNIIANAEKVSRRFKRLGFVYVALDLMGYRTGSMHEGA